MSGAQASLCGSCRAEVIWCETTTGKKMPVDAVPTAKGTVSIEERPGRAPLATIVSHAGLFDDPKRLLHMSHFATCPNAAAHRKPKS